MKKEDVFPNAKEFKTITCSSNNKTRIQKLSRDAFTHTNRCGDIVVSWLHVCRSKEYGTYISEFECHQAEADTIVIIIYVQIRKMGEHDIVVIDTEGTDVYAQAAFALCYIDGCLYIGNKLSHVLCEDEMSFVIPLHVMICDSNSRSFGHIKSKVYEK